MKTLALNSIVICLSSATLFGQTQSDIEFLRARADAHEQKISQLEKELTHIKRYYTEEPSVAKAATAAEAPKAPKAIPVVENGPAVSTYMVKKGDTLSRIAYRYNSSVAALKKENSLHSDRIRIGQKIRIPGASGQAVSSEKAAPALTAQASVAGHTVKSGETFYSIARDHNVSIRSLMAANPGVEPTRMRVGLKLAIDGGAKAAMATVPQGVANSADLPQQKSSMNTSKSKEVASKASAKKESAPVSGATVSGATVSGATKSSSEKISSETAIRTITVDQQITYGRFANQHGASTSQLNALNGLSLSKNTMLAKGSELYVPKY